MQPFAMQTPFARTDYSAAMLHDLAGRKVTVMGLGRFGGGVGVARWLASLPPVGQGADVLVTDTQSAGKLDASVKQLTDLTARRLVSLRLGEHNVADFTTCDLVIANPAVARPWDDRYLRAAAAAGVPITTEIRLLTERISRQQVIGITGSAGKSTTTAMIHHILLKAGLRAHLGGNIGGTLLTELPRIEPDDWIVLELSSAMLYWLGEGIGWTDAPGWSPRVAVLTNISANHIDWHGSYAHYQDSKRNIFKYQNAGGADSDRRVTIEALRDPAPPIALKLPGKHNQTNARLAIEAVRQATGLGHEQTAPLLADFPGLPHRLQLVAEGAGLTFYNDSKSTTPEATVLAVAAFDDPAKVHLIAGGYDKGSDLTPIAQLAARTAGLYTIGKTGQSLAANASQLGRAAFCETLDTAVDRAFDRMETGDILVLSPGCASWDQFTNYEARGEAFIRLVQHRLNLK
jgi:UDP-N-acetylmuramoylalanine--D-glutamate ligase